MVESIKVGVYYIDEIICRQKDGRIMPVIVYKGEKGYHLTDIRWNLTEKEALTNVRQLNKRLGISANEERKIILDSMSEVETVT